MSDERKIILSGKVFLYREKAPFVSSGVSVLGALEYDAAADKVRCHECGKWFKHVGQHSAHTHNLPAREYKAKHGLKLKSALCSEGPRQHYAAQKAPEHVAKFLEARNRPETLAKMRAAVSLSNKLNPKKDSVELRNESGRCHAQLLHRVGKLAAQLGHTPSRSELMKAGISPDSLFMNFNVDNMGSVMSLIGLKPNPQCLHPNGRYEPAMLVELLRDFFAKHKRIPTASDYRRKFLPHMSTFIKHFGNMDNAYKKAGLLKVARKQHQAERLDRAEGLAQWRNGLTAAERRSVSVTQSRANAEWWANADPEMRAQRIQAMQQARKVK